MSVLDRISLAELLDVPIALLCEPRMDRLLEGDIVYADEEVLAMLIVAGRL